MVRRERLPSSSKTPLLAWAGVSTEPPDWAPAMISQRSIATRRFLSALLSYSASRSIAAVCDSLGSSVCEL